MLAYNLVFFLLLFFSFAERFNLLISRYVPILFSILIVVIFTSIRGDVGQDTSNYLLMYNDIANYKDKLEPGFYYIALFFTSFGFHFNFFIFVTTVFSVAFYYFTILKFVPRKFVVLSFVIIFCDMYMYFNISGMRQGIALSICLVSSYFAFRRKALIFVLIVLFAATVHKSALVFLVVYPLLKLKVDFSFKKILMILSFSLICFVSTKYFLLGNESLSFIKGSVMYLSEGYNKFSINAYIVGFLRRLYPLVLFFVFYKNIKNDLITKSFFNVYLFGFVFYSINYPIFQDITVRISSYFLIFEAIIVIRILSSIRSSVNSLVVFVVIFIVVYFKISTYARLDAYHYELLQGFL